MILSAKHLGLFLAAILFVLLAAGVAVADNLSGPTAVTLSYSETKTVEKTECTGGGLLGAMNCVTTRIEEAGTTGETRAGATLNLSIKPTFHAAGNSRNVEVRLEVTGGEPAFSGELDAGAKPDVNSDARQVKEKLKAWVKQLTPGELDTLKMKNTLDLQVDSPFAGLKKLALSNPPAVVTLKVPVYKVEMKFLKKGAGGFTPVSEVTYGEVFVVEVTYSQPHADPDVFVDLNWDRASLPYEARLSRANTTGMVYHSDELRAGFYLKPKIEIAIDPGED